MTATVKADDPGLLAIKAAMGVAKDIAEGRVSPGQLDDVALVECRSLFGAVAGPDDPLWPLHVDVARQVLAAGGVPANELSEWLAVARAREVQAQLDTPQWMGNSQSWIEGMLEQFADDEEPTP